MIMGTLTYQSLGRPTDTSLPLMGHRPMYLMHKFFARKQANVIRKYIKLHSSEQDVVLDPFCGSGVMIGESLRLKRHAIGIDINPVSIFISKNTLTFVSPDLILDEFNRVRFEVAKEIESLYRSTCRICELPINAICLTWNHSELVDIRYNCPKDGKRIDLVNDYDLQLIDFIANNKDSRFFKKNGESKFWFPKLPLVYPDGTPFLKREHYNNIPELFTPRNLISLAKLFSSIQKCSNPQLKESLLFGFSSIVHLASKMVPVRPSRPFSSAWVQQSYWSVPNFMESNVWSLFDRAITGKQGLLNAKIDLKQSIDKIQYKSDINELFQKQNSQIPIYTLINSSLEKLKNIPDESIDYVITDPPYGHSIQYGELLFLWGAWLNLVDEYTTVLSQELIENSHQNKTIADYENHLFIIFKEIFRVLKPSKWLTVTFHNPQLKYRTILYRCAILSGFSLEEIHYQPPARPSAKSLLQPFGSLSGDYIFRFKKPKNAINKDFQLISEDQFEKIVVNLVYKIIKEYKTPIPFTLIQNSLDPKLYKKLYEHDMLLTFHPKKIESILSKHLGNLFVLSDIKWKITANKEVSMKGWFITENKHPKRPVS